MAVMMERFFKRQLMFGRKMALVGVKCFTLFLSFWPLNGAHDGRILQTFSFWLLDVASRADSGEFEKSLLRLFGHLISAITSICKVQILFDNAHS